MTRRTALATLAAPALLGLAPRGRAPETGSWPASYSVAPSLALLAGVAGGDTEAALTEAARRGFTRVEDALLLLRPDAERRALAAGLCARGLALGTFLANSGYADDGLAGGARGAADTLVADIEASAALARSMGAVHLTLIPGAEAEGQDGFGAAPSAVRRAASVAQRAGCVLAIEALDRRRYPGILVGSPREAGAFCHAVGHPACVVLFDAFQSPPPPEAHFDAVAAQTGYVQVIVTPEAPLPTSFLSHLEMSGYTGTIGVDMVGLDATECRAVLDASAPPEP